MRKLAIALAALLLTGACSAGPSQAEGPDDGLTPAETMAEFHAETAGFTLAPGWTWPKDLELEPTGPDGRPMLYQRGYGKTRAGWYWFCSWGRLFLSTPAQRDQAWTELEKIRGTFYYKTALLPPDRQKFEQMLSKTELGDIAEFANDIELNCPAATA